jgi:hypothetical protein
MRKLAALMFGLVLGCTHTQAPVAKVPEPEPVLSEDILYSLNLSLGEKCIAKHDPGNQFWQSFCFCTSRVIVNNVRAHQFRNMKDLSKKRWMVIPTEESLVSCLQEAFTVLEPVADGE